jgi:acyl-CoA synthetase (AMP-forming)/AMP-acid ligase II
VPYHAHVLLKWGNLSKFDLSSLRAITFSGNKLPPATIDQMREKLPGAQIFSMYGLTESTTRACYVPPELIIKKKDSCGRPLPGVELKIVAEDGSVLPSGMVGEVCLRGHNVMCGYFDEPELTAKTLVDGWLRTGDLGCVDDEGHLYLKGRMKDIIKCAGERISPAEIEEVIRQYSGVSETAVTGTPDPVLGEIVHAFVVPEGTINAAELRAFCAKNLSHHKIPRRYTFVKEIPKGATGKVQKHLLKESTDGK